MLFRAKLNISYHNHRMNIAGKYENMPSGMSIRCYVTEIFAAISRPLEALQTIASKIAAVLPVSSSRWNISLFPYSPALLIAAMVDEKI